ncbi:MAG: O-antigen ligase family protein [Acidobacteriota bacterium]|nr:O-antigen ligase family protein [Acidobacteriota bacterium]
MSESKRKSAVLKDGESSWFNRCAFVVLCAMPVFSVVAFGAVDIWALGANAVFAGLLIVFWTADAWRKKSFRFNANTLQIPLAALILIGLIQLLPLRSLNLPAQSLSIPATATLSFAPYATRFALIQLVIYCLFFAAALIFIGTTKRLRRVVVGIIGFGALMAFFGILQNLASLDGIYGVRLPVQAVPFASFVNRHHFAAFMEMTIGLTLGLLFGKATKSNKRIFLLIAVVIMGSALVLTSSRGGIISLLAVIVFVIAASLRGAPSAETAAPTEKTSLSRQTAFYIGGGVILVLGLFGAVILLGGDESLLRGIGLANQADASGGRFHFWQIAGRIFFDHPILGAGLDAFGTLFPQYDNWNGTYRIEQAHNDYLQTLADAGIIGFATIAAFIYLLFKKGRAVISQTADRFGRGAAVGALAGCLGILIHSFFDFPLRTPSNALFFLLLTAIATGSFSSAGQRRRKRTAPARTENLIDVR